MVQRLIQERNSVTRVLVEPRSFDQGRRKNDAFIHSATRPTEKLAEKFLEGRKLGGAIRIEPVLTTTNKRILEICEV